MTTLAKRPLFKTHPRLYLLLRKIGRTRNLAIMFAVASVVSVLATYASLTGSDNPLTDESQRVVALVVVDLIFLMGLTAIISRKVVRLMAERRKGSVGSMLQTRIVLMFSLVAIVPSIVMAMFSLVFFNYGVQAWFDQKVSTAINGSVEVARLYLEEHKKNIGADILAIARDLNRDVHNIRRDPSTFNSKLAILAGVRKLPEAIIFQKVQSDTNILARTRLSFSLEMILQSLSDEVFKRAQEGQLVIITTDAEDRVMALVRLEDFFDTYLLVGRFVDATIIEHMEETEGAATEYTMLKSGVSKLQVKYFVMFLIVSLLLLFVVVWAGFMFATALVDPVRGLIKATERVKEGDLSARVSEGHENDEVATLGRAFNDMARQLQRQRGELISAQRRAAWSDVARRIAHEIKNPLTPIQLATDRLRRKYSGQVEDKETFNKYIDTISRSVQSIGNMVEEFVSFARMPAPVFTDNDICTLMKDVVFSREDGDPAIHIECTTPPQAVMLNCDANQIVRVFTNLLKNAEESIQERRSSETRKKEGRIQVDVSVQDKQCHITIQDNGKGFSEAVLERVTEPYVTTKSKGTGLGLAIVKKIIEDHAGELKFANVKGGACVSICFPLER